MRANPYRPDIVLNKDDGAERNATLRWRTVTDLEDSMQWAKDQNRRLSSISRGRWSGTDTVEEYQDMLQKGWPEGITGVEGLDGLSTDAAERLTFPRNVAGCFPIVPAYLAGAPDSMLDCRPAKLDSVRGLTLVVDLCVHAGIDNQTVLAYARKVMKLVAWLQAERIDSSVYVSICEHYAGRYYTYIIPVRETGQVLQPERIAAMIHTSIFRRGWFAQIERDHYDYRLDGGLMCVDGGYGMPSRATADELRLILPEAYSVIILPKPGDGDPEKTLMDAISVKLREED